MKIRGKVIKINESQGKENLYLNKEKFVGKIGGEKKENSCYFLMINGCFGYGKDDDCIDELRKYGIKGVIAESFTPIRYRNLVNSGILPIMNLNNGWIKEDSEIEVDLKNWKIGSDTGKSKTDIAPINQTILDIFKSGGLFNIRR
jgi:3-isopropylmalate dehydratase small subunit